MASKTYKEVVIIGNGPSAITLSYLLAGNWPYLSGESHSNEFLQYRISKCLEKSLIEQDLEYLSDGLEGRSTNPVSLLFDMLNHPDADLGIENSSLLTWKEDCNKAINHVVLGRGMPGGCWQDMEGGILTISLGSWMELPDLSFSEWDSLSENDGDQKGGGHFSLYQHRATVGSVARYYQDYVEIKGLNQYFINHTVVQAVKKIQDPDDQSHLWQVKAQQALVNQETGETRVQELNYITPHVVLATGNSDQANRLNVPGEDLPFVLHSLNELEKLMMCKRLNSQSGKLLIVGAGLSAADAIIAAHFHGIETVHAFRRQVDDKELIFNKLPATMYPEYHKVHQMMRDCNGVCYEGYKSHPCHSVARISPNHYVTLQPVTPTNGPMLVIKCSFVLVLIGKKPALSYFPEEGKTLGSKPDTFVDSRHNTVAINSFSHESLNERNVYAMGPLVGDNFVRFIQGGALAIANNIHKKYINEKKS